MHSIFIVLFLIFKFSAEIQGQLDCQNADEFYEFAFIRPIVKLNTSDLCYWGYSQGPCAEGEWLAFAIDAIKIPNSTRIGMCKRRRCKEIEVKDWEFPTFPFFYNELCMTTDDINLDFCQNNSTKVYFGEEDVQPSCSEIRPDPINGRFFGIIGDAFNLLRRQDPASLESKNRSNVHREQIKGWK